jgi:hypothetical protein
MSQKLLAYTGRVSGTRELCEQDRRLGAVADAPELCALLAAQCDLRGA